MSGEILVVPRIGHGHLFPCMELCKYLLHRNFKITLLIDSDHTSSIPSSLHHSPLFQVADISSLSPPSSDPLPPFERFNHQMTQGIEALLNCRDPGLTRPVCAVIDHIMSKTQELFWKFDIPTVVFITSGACWAAMQHAAWAIQAGEMKPGEVRALPGLPKDMVLKYSDLKQRLPFPPRGRGIPNGPPSSGLKPLRGPRPPGEPASWVEAVKNSVAILFNTCNDLELPFLDYVANLTQKPIWAVGPLLPDQCWSSTDSPLRDTEIRPKHKSSYTEDEIIEWLDSKPRGSVIYVSFGSEVSPTMEEYPELAKALEESTRPFIWVIQREADRPGPRGGGQPGSGGYFPRGLDTKVGKRGMIIYGWAPQLLILSHPSTGGFVSHCGWNSTVEAIIRGVPFLAWPIRGDQYYNAKLVVCHLKVGTMVSDGYPADIVKKNDLLQGIERILSDEEIRKRSVALRCKFEHGFPASSLASLDAFRAFFNQKIV